MVRTVITVANNALHFVLATNDDGSQMAFLVDSKCLTQLDVTCGNAAIHTDTESSLANGIASLRQQYADIFEPPKGLPPDRGTEHVIPTLPDAQPPFMRMYR
jgi:hypothetical protein